MTQPPESISLEELGKRTGIEPRTIRSYIQRSLIPRPRGRGRAARYTKDHLHRLKAIQALRQAKRDLTLDQVRLLLGSLTPDKIEGLASGFITVGAIVDTDEPRGQSAWANSHLAGVGDSLDSFSKPDEDSRLRYSPTASSGRDLDSVGRLLLGLRQLIGEKPASRLARSETWHRIPINPDIELAVRGKFREERVAVFEEIADAFRHLLEYGSETT